MMATKALAAATGGRAFFDARDLTFAVQTADEDSHTAYVLGYYAADDMLDGKYHQIGQVNSSLWDRNSHSGAKVLEYFVQPIGDGTNHRLFH